MTNDIERDLNDIVMEEAPATASFMYTGRLVIEEWTYLPLEKRQRNGGYVKPDVPYYHVAVQPLSYTIGDGGQEGDGLEHTYVAIKSAQGELTPKGSGRDDLVKAFGKLGFPRNTIKDLKDNPAVGKVFQFKRYNRTYNRGTEVINGELMNVPFDKRPDDWKPEPGVEVPSYNRKPRNRDGGVSAAPTGVSSGGVAAPAAISLDKVAEALVGTPATEAAVRGFILERSDLAVGDVLDYAIGNKLLSELTGKGLVTTESGVVALA